MVLEFVKSHIAIPRHNDGRENIIKMIGTNGKSGDSLVLVCEGHAPDGRHMIGGEKADPIRAHSSNMAPHVRRSEHTVLLLNAKKVLATSSVISLDIAIEGE